MFHVQLRRKCILHLGYIAAPHIEGVTEAAAGLSGACSLAIVMALIGLVISLAFSLTHKK